MFSPTSTAGSKCLFITMLNAYGVLWYAPPRHHPNIELPFPPKWLYISIWTVATNRKFFKLHLISAFPYYIGTLNAKWLTSYVNTLYAVHVLGCAIEFSKIKIEFKFFGNLCINFFGLSLFLYLSHDSWLGAINMFAINSGCRSIVSWYSKHYLVHMTIASIAFGHNWRLIKALECNQIAYIKRTFPNSFYTSSWLL